jgi:hypothetical protein
MIGRCRAGIFLGCISTVVATSMAPQGRIVVGRNVHVTNDGAREHVEIEIAAHPTERSVLVAATVSGARWPNLDGQCKIFTSRDGGYTWFGTDLPELHLVSRGMTFFGCDPWTGFGKTGTALVSSLVSKSDENGKRIGMMLYLHRSIDSGRTWLPPAVVDTGSDAEMISVDHVSDRFPGRIYIGYMAGRACTAKSKMKSGDSVSYSICIAHSDDDGRTWSGPVVVANNAENRKWGLNHPHSQVLSDGTLFVPYVAWWNRDTPPGTPRDMLWYTISRDGGETFDTPKRITTNSGKFLYDAAGIVRTAVAVDAQSTRFRDRLYMLVRANGDSDSASDKRIYLSMSNDGGVSWTEPHLVDRTASRRTKQFHAKIAISRDGVVGLTWFDTRNAKKRDDYNLYFTASLDGGQTFLPAARVSTVTSNSRTAADAMTNIAANVTGDTMALRRGAWSGDTGLGGHYMGLTVDADGVFHPFWPDTRDGGAYQGYTARVRVESRQRVRHRA